MWVSNIWTANPTVEGWKDGWKGEECRALREKDRGEKFAFRLLNAASAPPGVSIVAPEVSVSTA